MPAPAAANRAETRRRRRRRNDNAPSPPREDDESYAPPRFRREPRSNQDTTKRPIPINRTRRTPTKPHHARQTTHPAPQNELHFREFFIGVYNVCTARDDSLVALAFNFFDQVGSSDDVSRKDRAASPRRRVTVALAFHFLDHQDDDAAVGVKEVKEMLTMIYGARCVRRATWDPTRRPPRSARSMIGLENANAFKWRRSIGMEWRVDADAGGARRGHGRCEEGWLGMARR